MKWHPDKNIDNKDQATAKKNLRILVRPMKY